MRALVAVASKHGATGEIADAIAHALNERGVDATVAAAESAPDPAGFDAVVLGSAVYVGRWLAPAREYAERHRRALASRPTFLFSSGPVGEPPVPAEHAVDVARIVEATGARDHRVFPGKIDKSRLGFGERALVTALRAPEGDYRDWDAVREWAAGVARALGEESDE